jgi:hypothetical protein
MKLKKNLGKKAIRNYLPLQPGDFQILYADIEKLKKLGYEPKLILILALRTL